MFIVFQPCLRCIDRLAKTLLTQTEGQNVCVEYEWCKTTPAALQTFQTVLAVNRPGEQSFCHNEDKCVVDEKDILRHLSKLSWIMGNVRDARRLLLASYARDD